MTRKTTTTETPTLLSNDRGAIGCELPGHAPFPGSDTWRWEGWREMTQHERDQFEAEVGRPATCETCAAIARNRRAS